jgi:nucleoside-diphosphate-sugar epimerase
MRVGVTGVSGYIGRLLFERLGADPGVSEVVGLDINPPPFTSEKLKFVKADIRSPSIQESLKGLDALVHLAFIVEPLKDRKTMYDINLRGSQNVLKAAEACSIPQLVVASSVAAYGTLNAGIEVIDEDTPLVEEPKCYYAHTKYLLEKELDGFEERNPGIIVSRLRPTVLMGPGCYNFSLELASWPVMLDVPGGGRIPIVHEEDAVQAFYLALKKKANGPFLISLPDSVPMAELGKILGKRRAILPGWAVYGLSWVMYRSGRGKFSPDWVVLFLKNRYGRFDVSRAKAKLGWEPVHGPEETVRSHFEGVKFSPWHMLRKKDFRIGGMDYRRAARKEA